MTRIPYLASRPRTLDEAAALRQAATFSDDASANRVMRHIGCAVEELRGFHNPLRAENVIVSAVAELLDITRDQAWTILKLIDGGDL